MENAYSRPFAAGDFDL